MSTRNKSDNKVCRSVYMFVCDCVMVATRYAGVCTCLCVTVWWWWQGVHGVP